MVSGCNACKDCWVNSNSDEAYCDMNNGKKIELSRGESRPKWCPKNSRIRLIDANKLFDEVGQVKPRNKEHYKSIGEFMNMITNSKTIESWPKGKWIDMSDGGRIQYVWYEKYMCNKCGERGTSAWSFCPNCGADMRR